MSLAACQGALRQLCTVNRALPASRAERRAGHRCGASTHGDVGAVIPCL